MAKCTINPISGLIRTLSGRVGNTLFKTYRNGQVRAYMIRPDQYKRTAPPTEAEQRERKRFAVIASEVARRKKAGDTRPRKVIWAEVRTEADQRQVRVKSDATRECL